MSIGKGIFLGFVLAVALVVIRDFFPQYFIHALVFISLVAIGSMCFQVYQHFAIDACSSRAIQALEAMPSIRMLSDYECQGLIKMACNVTDRRVYRINGSMGVKRYPVLRGNVYVDYYHIHDMKVSVFSAPYALHHILEDQENTFDVVVHNHELFIIRVNYAVLI